MASHIVISQFPGAQLSGALYRAAAEGWPELGSSLEGGREESTFDRTCWSAASISLGLKDTGFAHVTFTYGSLLLQTSPPGTVIAVCNKFTFTRSRTFHHRRCILPIAARAGLTLVLGVGTPQSGGTPWSVPPLPCIHQCLVGQVEQVGPILTTTSYDSIEFPPNSKTKIFKNP